MRTIISAVVMLSISLSLAAQDAKEILETVDKNMSSKNRIFESDMVIHGRRSSRTVTSKTYSEGDKQSFTEYLSPAREQGTKMLKQENKLWIYSPSTDRIIQISGHMLRQSVMGSDLSYEDMMEDKKMSDSYHAAVTGSEVFDDRDCWVVELTAKTRDLAYEMRKLWVDKERSIPLKQELFAKSGKLLKKMELKDVIRVEGRWFPTRYIFKDMLKTGDGTEFIIEDIHFNVDIPDYRFNKASLRK